MRKRKSTKNRCTHGNINDRKVIYHKVTINEFFSNKIELDNMIKQVSCEKYLLHNDDTEENKSKKEKTHYI